MHKFEIKGLLFSSGQEMEMHIQGILESIECKANVRYYTKMCSQYE